MPVASQTYVLFRPRGNKWKEVPPTPYTGNRQEYRKTDNYTEIST